MRKFIMVSVVAATAVFWIGILLVARWARSQASTGLSAEEVADRARLPAQGEALAILWDAPAFAYRDQNGRLLTDKDLRGHVWISDLFFTTCTTACPIMTANMAQLQKTIKNQSIEFVSFSVDPDHDTPAVLKEYAKMWKADDRRWHFLSTETQEKVAETAAGMKTFVQAPSKDTPIQHSSIFILSDGDGKVRGVYDSSDNAALKRLAFDASALAGTPLEAGYAAWPTPKSQDNSNNPGAALYAARGCVACHAQGRVAPPLEGCFGHPVRLNDGRTVTADEAYIRESILDPNAKVVAGYPPLMPSYRGLLTDTELSELVDYVKSLGGARSTELLVATSPASEAGKTIDPVCKMSVPAAGNPLHAEFRGMTYYFCSTTCREHFLKDPGKFATHSENPATLPVTAP